MTFQHTLLFLFVGFVLLIPQKSVAQEVVNTSDQKTFFQQTEDIQLCIDWHLAQVVEGDILSEKELMLLHRGLYSCWEKTYLAQNEAMDFLTLARGQLIEVRLDQEEAFGRYCEQSNLLDHQRKKRSWVARYKDQIRRQAPVWQTSSLFLSQVHPDDPFEQLKRQKEQAFEETQDADNLVETIHQDCRYAMTLVSLYGGLLVEIEELQALIQEILESKQEEE